MYQWVAIQEVFLTLGHDQEHLKVIELGKYFPEYN